MKSYICPRCGYKTNIKIDLKRHFARKKECPIKYANISIEKCIELVFSEENEASTFCKHFHGKTSTFHVDNVNISSTFSEKMSTCHVDAQNLEEVTQNIKNEPSDRTYKCRKCEKDFKYRQSRYVHEKKCNNFVKNKDEIIANLVVENNKLRENQQNISKKINNYNGSTINSETNNNCNTYSHNNTQNNITINAFGKENLDYITKEFVQAIVNEGPYGSIQKLVKYLHFNPKHRENQNIKIPNKRDKFGLIYNGKDWVLQNKQNMITTITEHAFDIITDHCDGMLNRKYDKFCEEFEGNVKTCINRVNTDTELLILNEQKKI